MKILHRTAVLVVALGVAACASAPMAASDPDAAAMNPNEGREAAGAGEAASTVAPTGAALAFSDEQADRGRNVFRSACTECHNSSEFSDRQFKFKWRRRSAGDLFGHISTTMPEDAPGSLSGQSYADLVAYILRMNGLEAGEGELPADEQALDALSLSPIGS